MVTCKQHCVTRLATMRPYDHVTARYSCSITLGPQCFQAGKQAPRDFTRVRMSMAKAAMQGTTQFPNWCKRCRSSWLTESINQRSIGIALGSFHTSWRCFDRGSTPACSGKRPTIQEQNKTKSLTLSQIQEQELNDLTCQRSSEGSQHSRNTRARKASAAP